MKPTDEAKRLREEIALMIAEESEPVDMIINKVLDAAEKSLTDCLLYECVDVGPGSVIIESINKLRP